MVAKTILVLDPTARARVSETPMAPRLESLVGKKVGFLDNSKPNADILIARIKARLEERFEFGGTLQRRKHNAGSGLREGVLEELATCDLVINGVGDWGACTSWSVHDSLELEKRGIPTGTLCTEEFASLGRLEAEALGVPTIPIVTFPHPLGGLRQEEVQQKADKVIEELLHVLTQPREKLAQEYRGRYPQPKSTFKPKPLFG